MTKLHGLQLTSFAFGRRRMLLFVFFPCCSSRCFCPHLQVIAFFNTSLSIWAADSRRIGLPTHAALGVSFLLINLTCCYRKAGALAERGCCLLNGQGLPRVQAAMFVQPGPNDKSASHFARALEADCTYKHACDRGQPHLSKPHERAGAGGA